ncbi:putative glycoside hydrolase [Candidatus Cardinium sp. cBcalN1]|uniref:putative glycoside hydrolase n=2 Tax=unclassified Candidatus Cardinium TaxID=2641185 RepID=UPI001FB4DF38|nr:putative glycoside hydrolase [Candidatus Cardinium sp. cBcalN1]
MYKSRLGGLVFIFLLLESSFLWASGMGNYRLSLLGELEKKIWRGWVFAKGEGLPLRWIYPFKAMEKRPLTAVASTLARPEQVIVATGEEILLSQDGGQTFRWVADRHAIAHLSYFTAGAISEENPNEWIVGTSCHGFYITRDAGKSWRAIPAAAICLSGQYYETINDIAYHLSDPDKVYFAYGPHGKIALLNIKTGFIEPILSLPEPDGIVSLSTIKVNSDVWLIGQTQSSIWIFCNNKWLKNRTLYTGFSPYFSEPRRKKIQDKRGIYLTAWTANNLQSLRNHFVFIKHNGMNAVVIDFKDDFGSIMYNSQVAMAREAKAIRPIVNIEALRTLADEFNIHLIARLVVFKDEKLYRYASNRYALWDKKRDAPWAHFIKNSTGKLIQREYWVDIFSTQVWDYNLQIAEELQRLGIDEIQFDYIRLPSDGPLGTIAYRHNIYEMKAIDALESFLKRARAVLSLPISVNVFGYNGWFLTNALGQNIQRLALYVDAISPMTYPSHYHTKFLGTMPYLKRANLLYKIGSDRAAFYTKEQTCIRQYVQAFLLGPERKFSKETYSNYIKEQIAGVYSSKGSGFLLWNASNNYYMVKQDLAPSHLWY